MEHFLKETIKKAGGIALGYFGTELETKTKSNLADLITQADIAVSDYIVHAIGQAYPDHHIRCEELDEDINPGAPYEWVIDPIDGTRNFAQGIPFWCTIIALMKDGERYMGAVYNPVSEHLFFAEKGKGAYLNDRRIHVNTVQSMDAAFGVFSRANNMGIYGDYIERYRAANAKLVLQSESWIHNYGCSLQLCYLASGGVDFVTGNAGMDWDYLAAFLICEEAGARLTDSDGNEWKRGRQDYVMANPDLHPKVMELFR
ncbi:MAG: hypothetical protein COU35_01035 [Candidatus Magasanikbacteria bacterium CG10_big_fil_rev_8_21_14_0_10_47_10]|uniref:Inositol monophosphatase n=1 Tax=Candidatus Magasanikbacteria bacterium CG10_big_fil_rev_8_21_14_0_10_47_10 TaxID=1974652 RepID=A0A2H0TT66_9BACT|nr:MAG: hypothetical protein COU35_01035 [Candidatus Magasanikbacteria bacterium CG10_big_fil_rev_8_21_14_0_10_47_10]